MGRGKTFTGCWTCRDRRLKCDEVRPVCVRCSSKGLDCAGYGSRLHWLDPLSYAPSLSADVYKSAEKGLQRRRLLPANGIVRLSDEQVDSLLSKINDDQVGSQQCVQGPFGVFRIDRVVVDVDRDDESTDKIKLPLSSDVSNYGQAVPTINVGTHPAILPDRTSGGIVQHDVDRTVRTELIGHSPQSGLSTAQSASIRQDVVRLIRSPDYSSITSPISPDSLISLESPTSTCVSAQCRYNRPKFLTIEVKFLLNHYRDHVLPFFSVLDNKHTPWRVLHFPKVLQAACETEISGPPDGPSNVLLYAILTISAYSLQNREGKRLNRHSSHRWEDVATNYRGQALKLLKIHVGTHSRDMIDSEYQELLAAMLSMVTIDVMCGDTRTCEIHLEACQALVTSHMEVCGHRLSKLSKALHTTFIYLRIMQQAAGVNSPEIYVEADPAESGLITLQNSDFKSFVDFDGHSGLGYDSFSSEMIYGVPLELFLFLRSTIRLAKKKKFAKSPTISRDDLRELDLACDQLEDSILEWPVDEVVARYQEATLSPGNCEVMEHYTRAFHIAIIIYFFDQIHQTRRRLLQHYVRSVVDHLERVEEAKNKHGIVAGPLLWPAFVAASQAIDTVTRDRFLAWLESGDTLGVGTSKATVRLLQQLWLRSEGAGSEDATIAIYQQRLVLT